MNNVRAYFITVSLAIAPLFACSPSPDGTISPRDPAPAPTFGPEERRIAGLLSLGGSTQKQGGSQLERAATCEMALAFLEKRAREEQLLTPAQASLIAQAKAVYRSRAGKNRDSKEGRTAVRAAEEKYPDASTRARLAVGCLRELR